MKNTNSLNDLDGTSSASINSPKQNLGNIGLVLGHLNGPNYMLT